MGPSAGPGGAPPGGAEGGGWAGVAASLRRSGGVRPSRGAGAGTPAEAGAPAGAGEAPPPPVLLSAAEVKAQARRVLAAEARKSPVDRETGKVRCLTCRRAFVSFRVLEQHLKDKHGGINSEEAPLWAKGPTSPPAGTAGKGKGRTLSLADFAVRAPAGRGQQPRVERVAVRGGAVVKPRPKEASRGGGSGREVANPNTLSSMQTLVRRGKEREQGKKSKKPSLMKRAVQHSRSEAGLNSARELEQRCRARVEEARCRLAEMLQCSEAGEVTATVPAPAGGGAASSVGAENPPPKDFGFAWVLRRQYSAAVSQAEEQLKRSEDVLKEVTCEATLQIVRELIHDLIREVICDVELEEQGTPVSREEGELAAENDGAESCEGGSDAKEAGQEEGQGIGSATMEFVTLDAASATGDPRSGSSASGAVGGEGGGLSSEGEGGKALDKEEAWRALEPTRARIREALERRVYHCGLCSVDCSSLDHFVNHCNGAKHLKASRKLAHVEVVRLKRSDETGSLVDGWETPSRCYQGQNSDSTYATHEVSPELNAAAKEMLSKLHGFQERLRITDPMKFKARRRLLYGLREATKAVKLGKVKSLIVAPNIEQTSAESKGRGPDDALARILAAAEEREVPILFALTRAKMGKIVGSRSRISIVAVLDCSGAEQLHKQVLEMAKEMKKIDLEKKKVKIVYS